MSQKQRIGDVALVVRVRIGKQWQSERVEHFNCRHIDARTVNAGEVEWKEVQVVVGMQRVAIELDVSFKLQVLAGLEQ